MTGVRVAVPAEPAARIGIEIGGLHDDEAETVQWDQVLTALVVAPALLSPADAADRRPAVEERDRLVVLALAVLDDDPVVRVVGVDRQSASHAGGVGVAAQPVEAVLASCPLAEDLVAQVDDVRLVGRRSRPCRSRARRRATGRTVRVLGEVAAYGFHLVGRQVPGRAVLGRTAWVRPSQEPADVDGLDVELTREVRRTHDASVADHRASVDPSLAAAPDGTDRPSADPHRATAGALGCPVGSVLEHLVGSDLLRVTNR